MERLHALMRDADEENVFWIDDENDDDDFFVFSALSISNPDLEETKQTPSFLRLHFELFEVLFIEEEAAMHKLEDDKANMMIENFTVMFFCCFSCQKKNIQHHKKIQRDSFYPCIIEVFQQVDITQLKIDMQFKMHSILDITDKKCIRVKTSAIFSVPLI